MRGIAPVMCAPQSLDNPIERQATPMPNIQIDMFEVQLGASLLLQFKDSTGRSVCVLADGGINAASYTRDHVAKKLANILPSKSIDVVIGTHYDQDHLAGLIDVAGMFNIGEAILPPVRRPRYPRPGTPASALMQIENPDDASDLPLLIDLSDEEFEEHISELAMLSEQVANQLRGAEPIFPSPPDFENEIPGSDDELGSYYLTAPYSPAMLNLALVQFTRIRKSAHQGAIVAKWLQRLVSKLQSKNVPIRAIDIQAGCPRYFEWDPVQLEFLACKPSVYASSLEPKFTLLGPSQALIARHAKLLPIGAYLAIIGRMPLKPVTVSNQLSYVMLFESAGQKILVTGDAGCVDFWDKKSKAYYPQLLTAIKDPNVVQVAHHAGDNFRFYDVLQTSGYAGCGAPHSFLLLSHADGDAYRPSPAFNSFVNTLSAAGGSFELLTTSQPDPAKIAAFRTYYHPATHAPANVGDIRLSFQNGAWKVDQHLVQT